MVCNRQFGALIAGLLFGPLLGLLSSPVASRTLPIWPGAMVIGTIDRIHAEYEDTLAGIGDRYSLGYTELLNANPGVDPWLPGEETPIVLPTQFILPDGPREGIVINLAEFRLYHFEPGQVTTYPVGIGRSSAPSPLTRTSITMRLESPAWYPPESVIAEHRAEGEELPRVVPPGPDNPLGPYALILAEDGYLIHGTNKGFGIGTQVSHGCIRMYNQDISELIWKVDKGTPVRIIDEPVKFGVQEGILWVEVHRPDTEQSRQSQDHLWRIATEKLKQIKRMQPGLELNRGRLEQALEQSDGIPQPVGEILSAQVAHDQSRSDRRRERHREDG